MPAKPRITAGRLIAKCRRAGGSAAQTGLITTRRGEDEFQRFLNDLALILERLIKRPVTLRRSDLTTFNKDPQPFDQVRLRLRCFSSPFEIYLPADCAQHICELVMDQPPSSQLAPPNARMLTAISFLAAKALITHRSFLEQRVYLLGIEAVTSLPIPAGELNRMVVVELVLDGSSYTLFSSLAVSLSQRFSKYAAHSLPSIERRRLLERISACCKVVINAEVPAAWQLLRSAPGTQLLLESVQIELRLADEKNTGGLQGAASLHAAVALAKRDVKNGLLFEIGRVLVTGGV